MNIFQLLGEWSASHEWSEAQAPVLLGFVEKSIWSDTRPSNPGSRIIRERETDA